MDSNTNISSCSKNSMCQIHEINDLQIKSFNDSVFLQMSIS